MTAGSYLVHARATYIYFDGDFRFTFNHTQECGKPHIPADESWDNFADAKRWALAKFGEWPVVDLTGEDPDGSHGPNIPWVIQDPEWPAD